MDHDLHLANPPSDVHCVNLAESLRRLRGDRRLLLDLITFFLEDYPQVVTELHTAANERNWAELHRAAHSLKGLAANFDAQEVIETAGDIELNAKSGDLAHAASLVPKLDLALSRLTLALSNYREAQTV